MFAEKAVSGVAEVNVAAEPDGNMLATIVLLADAPPESEALIDEALAPFTFAWRCRRTNQNPNLARM